MSRKKAIGRPRKWPDHYLQILLVLRLCGLQLKEILQVVILLSDGTFKPEERNSQATLRTMLWEGYQNFCTTNTETLRIRIRCTKLFKPPNTRSIFVDKTLSCNNVSTATTQSASITNDMPLDIERDHMAERPSQSPEMQANVLSLARPYHFSTTCHPYIQTEKNSIASSNHPDSESSSTMGQSMSSQRSNDNSIVADYGDKFRDILKRGSRTSSCISEIVSLLDRFSIDEPRDSTHDSVDRERQWNESTLSENATSQSIPEPQPLDFDNHSYIGSLDCSPQLLMQHRETLRRHNAALIASCRGCSETKKCIHGEITRATLSVNDFSKTIPPILSMGKRGYDYAEIDCYGNNLLFFAARVAVPLFILLEIIQNTPELDTLNTDGQNFLFVLDPRKLDGSTSQDSDFSTLISYLEHRHFNFDHLDHNGRSFLVFLCLHPCFRMGWITLLFQRNQAWQQRIHALAQEKDSAGMNLVGYLKRHPDFRNMHPYVLSIISRPENLHNRHSNGRTILHEQMVQHLLTYTLDFPKQRPTELPMYPFQWDGSNVNAYDNEGYTPLTFLASKALGNLSRVSRHFVVFKMNELVTFGADINARCRNGDTLLHMAARKSDFEIMQFLLNAGIQINHQNNEGLRAIDYITPTISNPTSIAMTKDGASLVQTLQCLFLLLHYGSTPYAMLSWG